MQRRALKTNCARPTKVRVGCETLEQLLGTHDFDKTLINELSSSWEELSPIDLDTQLTELFSQTFSFDGSLGKEQSDANTYLFIGPRGAGVSTLVSKLAQWISFAWDRVVCASGMTSIAQTEETPLHLIDGSECDLQDIDFVLSREQNIKVVLVVPANLSVLEARRVIKNYSSFSPALIAVSKLDRCHSLGPLLGVVKQIGAPLGFFSTGPRVPHDLEPASPKRLARALSSMIH